jgi:transcriptional regulator with XRE-family HTH domain
MDLKKLTGARIYELRSKARLTQEQVAEKANISKDTVSRIERGIRSPSFDILQRLAAVFHVEVCELFNFSDKKFLGNNYHLELVELLNYLGDKTPSRIKTIQKIAQILFERKNNIGDGKK